MKLSKLSIAILASLSSSIAIAESTTMNDIVVTANNMSQNIKSVTSQVAIISRDEIEEKNYQNLSDAVKNIAGISVKSTGGIGKASSIFIRGASSSDRQVLIMIDGIEQTDPAGFGTNIANIKLDNVERIEILKGPQSGVWGANASAGVINIITIKGQKQALVNIELGANNTQKLSTTLGAGNEQFDFSVHLSTLTTDGFTAVKPYKADEHDFEDDAFDQTDFAFKMGMNLTPTHRIETLIKTLSANNEYDGSSTPNIDTYSNTNDIKTRQLQYLYKENNLNAKLFINDQNIESSFSSGYQSEGLIEGLGGQIGYKYGQNNQMNASIEKKHFKNILGDKEHTNMGYAVTNTHYLGASLVLNEALRYDEYDTFKNATTGKVGLKYQFADQIFVSANYGTGYNAPALYQIITANPGQLKPESVEGYEFTLGAYGADITYFNSVTDNLIIGEGSWPNNYYVNSDGKTSTEGWEFNYTQTIDSLKTDMSLSSTWLSTKNSNDQLKAYIPQQQASLSLDNYSVNNLHLGLETRYTGQNYSANDELGAQIGEYFITDLNADYQLNKHLNLYAKIVNVTDEDYITSVADYPATNVTPNYVYSSGGRQLFVGIRGNL